MASSKGIGNKVEKSHNKLKEEKIRKKMKKRNDIT